uniref:PRKCA-binding protein n=1 Tax=Panagrellus redivivus TaxID=6233 RepID=A0A7E4ZT19_PANRE
MAATPEGVRLIPDLTELHKDPNKGHIGIGIGGGAPICNCIYVVQVFDGSPCAADGKISVGDEIVAVNGISVRGSDKAAVANLIRKSSSPVRLSFNRIHVDPERGRTLDILFKKIKHWVVESIEPKTADALGLSRAVLCNDVLQKLLERLDANENFYKKLHEKLQRLLRCHANCSETQNELGALFGQIAVRELSPECVNFFTQYADIQSALHKENTQFVTQVEKVIDSIQSYVKNAIPDVRLSLSKYMNAKFEYLSYCLKIKEMEDEEVEMAEYNEYPGRMETGNYEYRVMLKCRESSRSKFIDMRNHVQIKIQLLDEKQISDLPSQLRQLISAMRDVNANCRKVLRNAFSGEFMGIVINKEHVDNEIYGIMRHLGVEAEKRDQLVVQDSIETDAPPKQPMSINHWRNTRARATWPPDDDAEEAMEDPTESEEDGLTVEKPVTEENLIDLDFVQTEDDNNPWPETNWDLPAAADEADNLLKDLIPTEWLTAKTTDSADKSAQKGVEIEPELLQHFRSEGAEMLLVDL